MDQRDCLDLVSGMLKTAEGKKLVADALDSATVDCHIVAGGTLPQQSQTRLSGFEVRAHSIFSVHGRDETGSRKLLFDFVNKPREVLDSYKARHSVLNGIGQASWRIFPAEAVLVGIGVDFVTPLRQLFTPAVEVASHLRSTYYASDPLVPNQAVVLLVNDGDSDFLLHKDRLLGQVQFHRAVNRVRLNHVGEPND